MRRPEARRHGQAREQVGSVYGRHLYEVMRYWDEDHPEWDSERRDFAEAWRRQPKWVVSRSLKSVGPNVTLVGDDLETVMREIKAQFEGEIEIGGPALAKSLGELGLIDAYRIYLHPVVLGHGKPYFAGPRPPLRFVASEQIDENVVRLTYLRPCLAERRHEDTERGQHHRRLHRRFSWSRAKHPSGNT